MVLPGAHSAASARALTPHVPTPDLTHKILKRRRHRAGEGVIAVSRVGPADLALTRLRYGAWMTSLQRGCKHSNNSRIGQTAG
jgi:hypothetical protein